MAKCHIVGNLMHWLKYDAQASKKKRRIIDGEKNARLKSRIFLSVVQENIFLISPRTCWNKISVSNLD